jgi:hypothetical protein
VSRLCGEIDDKVKAFLACPIEGEYLWIDAGKVRQKGRIVSVAPASSGETSAAGPVSDLTGRSDDVRSSALSGVTEMPASSATQIEPSQADHHWHAPQTVRRQSSHGNRSRRGKIPQGHIRGATT